MKHSENYTLTVIKLKNDQSEESQDENYIISFFVNPLTDDRGQTQFCENLIANLFERGNSPCTTEFPKKSQKTTY